MSTHIEEDIRRNEMLTVKEVATYLRVSRVTIWRWCQKGLLPASRVGRNWRIRRDDLLFLLNKPQHSPFPNPALHSSKPETTSQSQSTKASLLNNDADANYDQNGSGDTLNQDPRES